MKRFDNRLLWILLLAALLAARIYSDVETGQVASAIDHLRSGQ